MDNQILFSIDNLNDIRNESEFLVIESLLNSYDKALMIMEYYEGDDVESFSIFQEGFFVEADQNADDDTKFKFRQIDKKSGKTESIFKSILYALPRLIGLIKNFIKQKFSKKEQDKAKKGSSAIDEFINNSSKAGIQFSDFFKPKDEYDDTIADTIAMTTSKWSQSLKKGVIRILADMAITGAATGVAYLGARKATESMAQHTKGSAKTPEEKKERKESAKSTGNIVAAGTAALVGSQTLLKHNPVAAIIISGVLLWVTDGQLFSHPLGGAFSHLKKTKAGEKVSKITSIFKSNDKNDTEMIGKIVKSPLSKLAEDHRNNVAKRTKLWHDAGIIFRRICSNIKNFFRTKLLGYKTMGETDLVYKIDEMTKKISINYDVELWKKWISDNISFIEQVNAFIDGKKTALGKENEKRYDKNLNHKDKTTYTDEKILNHTYFNIAGDSLKTIEKSKIKKYDSVTVLSTHINDLATGGITSGTQDERSMGVLLDKTNATITRLKAVYDSSNTSNNTTNSLYKYLINLLEFILKTVKDLNLLNATLFDYFKTLGELVEGIEYAPIPEEIKVEEVPVVDSLDEFINMI